ncbi:KDO transferase A isoform X1 [Carex rostrata]
MNSVWRGRLAYEIYRAVTRAAAPALYYLVEWRRRRRWWRKQGNAEKVPFAAPGVRPPGTPLVWVHAVSLGEALAALPLVRHHYSLSVPTSSFVILMTTTTFSAFEVVKDLLPDGVIFQMAPIDTPAAVERFIGYWDPCAILLIESELWPNLILYAAQKGIKLGLLNARMSRKSFMRWSTPLALPLISLMLSKFSLIAPLSNTEALRYQLLGASPTIIHFASDLKYAVGDYEIKEKERKTILDDLMDQISNRPTWLAASIHSGEEQVMIQAHNELIKIFPELLLILVTRHPQDGYRTGLELKRQEVNVAIRSKKEAISPSTCIYVVDTLGELRVLYRASGVAVIGGSFLPGLCGHNVSEAAAAACAILTGPHVGHFHHMLMEMRQINPFSVKQVKGLKELVEGLKMLLGDENVRKKHQKAAKESFEIMSKGVVHSVWYLVSNFVLQSVKPLNSK